MYKTLLAQVQQRETLRIAFAYRTINNGDSRSYDDRFPCYRAMSIYFSKGEGNKKTVAGTKSSVHRGSIESIVG